MMISRRAMGGASAALFGQLFLGSQLVSRTAEATTALALSLDDLVRSSYRVALVTPTRSTAAWEHADGQRRIVTRTQVLLQDVWRTRPEEDTQSDEDGQELVVCTLGGRVGDLQQKVHGEASLRSDEPLLIFAGRFRDGGRRIVGMAQGTYPLTEIDGKTRLRPSRDLPQLVRRPATEPAIDLLPTLDLSAARRRIEAAR